MQVQTSRQLIGRVVLTVRDLEKCLSYYQQQIGLTLLHREGDTAHLGVGDTVLLTLEGNAAAVSYGPTAGLYHFALLLPSRQALALQLQHFIRNRVRLSGTSDHLVSEALYLSDPEGNGIEIYADRAREDWRWINGEIDMQTLPLSLEDLVKQLPDDAEAQGFMPEGTIMGHVHLRVSDLAVASEFYTDVVGLDITTRSYPGALFLSKGGYHHHLGLNTWRSAGAPAAVAGAPGLKHFEYWPESEEEWHGIRSRATARGVTVEDQGSSTYQLTDPSGNSIRFILIR